MGVVNQHARRLPGSTADAGALIDGLAGQGDRLWPSDQWPAMRLDRPLGAGAAGGHGPIRYQVESYTPGLAIRFRFGAPRGFDGFHEFTLHRSGAGETELRHLLVLRLRGRAWLSYPLLWRPLHDALIEDALDRAEREFTGRLRSPARWSRYVRLLRGALSARS
ncbi:SRPBCC family protein [Amycolatopsis aidingensis]|uniref:SRPBCC family protein n=1 Tax=Amycolatopsis aidingensis TaxID=2842453 RepID=UPI001C0B8661|nr:SRPBCC family protein [Amycolatopsis aidingensis]